MTPQELAEIEARLAKAYITTGKELRQERLAQACTDMHTLLTALKAETARADKAENGLLDEAEHSADLQSQLTAANEKLASRERQLERTQLQLGLLTREEVMINNSNLNKEN